MVDDFFTREELDACREDIKTIVENVAQKLYNAGKLKKLYREYGLFERITKMAEEFPGTSVVFFKMSQRVVPSIQKIWANERLLNVIEQLIGPEIAGHPVWNLRPTAPKAQLTLVPWHQDAGYLQTDSYSVLQPTAWIPFLDTNEENGCLQFVSGGHKMGKVAMHQCCHGGTWYVMLEEKEMEKTLGVNMKEDVVTCPVNYGGMVLFNNLIPHQGIPNTSKVIRWSMDLRWQRPSDPIGFYGLKDGILLRSPDQPDLVPDWESFNNVNRNKVQTEATSGKEDEELDPILYGPWMKKWEIVHVNRHVEAFQVNEEKQTHA